MSDILSTALSSLLFVMTAVVCTASWERKIPTRLRLYRFHLIFYPCLIVVGLVVTILIKLFPTFDWWVNEATLFLLLGLGIVGSVLCVGLAPFVWWLERRTDLMTLRVGKILILVAIFIPYFVIGSLLIFYRE